MNPTNVGTPFSITRVNDGTAGVVEVLAAPSGPNSHYIDGIAVSQGDPWDPSNPDGFTVLRRSCAVLNSATDTITVADAATIKMATGDFSLELWLCWITGTLAAIPALLSKFAGTEGYKIETTAAGLPKVTFGDADESVSLTGTRNICDGRWHHIAVSVDRDVVAGYILYVDGVAVTTSATGATNPVAIEGGVDAAATNLVLTGVASVTFRVCGVGVYKAKALTEAEVLARYKKGLQLSSYTPVQSAGRGAKFVGDETGLVCGLNLDEGTGSIGYDMTSNSNDATLVNVTWTDQDGLPLGIEAAPNLIFIPSSGPLNSVQFNPPVRMGRGNPIRLLETDGAWQATITGHTGG
jgi:hypothetical protein